MLVAAALLFFGCASSSGPRGYGNGRSSFEGGFPSAGHGEEVSEEVVREDLEVARVLMGQRRFDEALDLLADALSSSSHISSDLKAEVLATRRDCKKLLIQETVLSGRVQAATTMVELGNSIRLTWTLENRSSELLTVPARSKRGGLFSRSSSWTQVVIKVGAVEVDPLGTRVVHEWDESFDLEEDLRLAPGAQVSRDLEVKTVGRPFFAEDRLVYRRLRMEIRLPATLVRQGGDEAFLGLDFGQVEVELYPKGFQRIDREASRFLEEALGEKRNHPSAPTIALLSGSLLARRDRIGCRQRLASLADETLSPELIRTMQAIEVILELPPIAPADEWEPRDSR